MSELFSSLRLRGLEFRNRVFVSPMCQYSSREGLANDWHMVHLGSRAVGGAALVCAEATAVSPEGRISPGDAGLWSDAHAEAFAPVAAFIKSQGAVAAVQLAHAGRKASTDVPWRGGKPLSESEGGWQTLAPSALPFAEGQPVPRETGEGDLDAVVSQFRDAAARSLAAGFEVVELHMAHGYLLHEFLSPLSNHRQDRYGGGFDDRVRLPLRVTEAVREVWPERLPLFARISATDWAEGGWDIEQSVEFSKRLKAAGVDLIDCSSGGLVPGVKIPVGPGYQVPFAAAVRERAGVATGAVGMITEAHQAEEIIAGGKADAVLLARALLRDPYWTLRAAKALGVKADWPVQYGRADG
ncbi:MAG TPA: NADH:flavin oxidoreductase/NADH oxidase [Pyrinomonadaceae bacterium]|nr:NADH:flavin oxidoreductase/NADH oxidase [Pyrinomonadaceae bacterium]